MSRARRVGNPFQKFFRFFASLFQPMTDALRRGELPSFLLTLSAVALFVPYLGCLPVIFTAGYALFLPHQRKKLLAVSGGRYLFLFFIPLLLLPILYGNLLGLLAGLGMAVILIFALFARANMTPRLFEQILDLILFCSILAAVYAVIQTQIIILPLHGNRAFSFFFNPNYYGFMLEFFTLLSFYRLIKAKTAARKWWYLFCLGANVLGLALCNSLGAILATFGGALVLLFLSKHYRLFLLVLACLLFFLFMTYVFPTFFPRVQGVGGTTNTRLTIWDTALMAFLQTPFFGRGLITYLDIHTQFGGYATFHAHSLYLDTLLNFGFCGTLLLLVYFCKQYFVVVKNFIYRKKILLSSLLLGGLACILIHGIVDTVILWPACAILTTLLLSGVVGLEHYPSPDRRLTPAEFFAPSQE
ncbi:MAG: O-antigen ligase family protein [Oscillospiraceae bacterium]|nr:O-antigen ligase family protein [Oscillospiraceae bacterium]